MRRASRRCATTERGVAAPLRTPPSCDRGTRAAFCSSTRTPPLVPRCERHPDYTRGLHGAESAHLAGECFRYLVATKRTIPLATSRRTDPSGSVATAEAGSIAGFPQRVFLVPVGVGRNRLVCSSLPRQTPVTLSRDARVAGPRGPAELAPIHFFTRSELLMFMNCPDCGLKVRLVAPYLLLERCPRCLVRRGQIVEMRVTTDLPNDASAPAPLRHSAG